MNPINPMNTMFLDMKLVHKEAEMTVLGCYIKLPSLVDETTLVPESFFYPEHQRIMKALLALAEKRYPIDVVSIIEEVGFAHLNEIGGQAKLTELVNVVISTENVHYHEKLVKEYAQKRKVIEIADQIKTDVVSGESENLSDSIQTHISNLMNLDTTNEDDDDGDILEDLVELYDEFETDTGEITGMSTGYGEFDRMTSGLQDGDLVIVGARPSVGKTAFCLNIALNVTETKNQQPNQEVICAIFSLEMPKKQLLKRCLSTMGNIDAIRLRNPQGSFNDGDWNSLTIAMGALTNRGVRMFDKAGVNVHYIWRKVRRLRQQHPNAKIEVIIDYLQLIQGNPDHRGNRQQEVSEISRSLKLMAREFKANVIALSQLSRGVEQRQDKRPMMSDLRESGAIEQDADMIAFLYRDDYYDKESENKNIIEIIIAKQRNGPIGTVQLAFIKEYGKFVNLERRFDDGSVPENTSD